MRATRFENLITAVLLFALACSQRLVGQTDSVPVAIPTPRIFINADVGMMAALGHLADTAMVERFACLTGSLSTIDGSQETLPAKLRLGDTLVTLNSIYLPEAKIERRASVAVAPGVCPPNTYFVWHTHPVVPSLAYLKSIGIKATEPSDACFFSKSDLEHGYWKGGTVLGEVVQVNARVFCYWFSSQLAQVPPLNWVSVVRPIKGQVRTDWGDRPSERP